MELILFLAFFVVVFGALAVAASGFGVDSRELSDDPHRPSYPVGIA